MSRKTELRDFLRSRRSRLQPEAVGLPSSGRRRVEGLRREEVASLAGVSVDYYIRLEQGRDLVPSDSVVDAVARALMLDDVEREHFSSLIHSVGDAAEAPDQPAASEVRPEVTHLLEFLDTPAIVVGRGTSILASNPYARALIADFDAMAPDRRTYADWLFLDPAARTLHEGSWEPNARETVAVLRRETALYPHDAWLDTLTGQLRGESAEFGAWWADHEVEIHNHGAKHYNHPVAGHMVVSHEATRLRDPDQWLYLYWVEPGSPSEAAMRLLQSRVAGGAAPA